MRKTTETMSREQNPGEEEIRDTSSKRNFFIALIKQRTYFVKYEGTDSRSWLWADSAKPKLYHVNFCGHHICNAGILFQTGRLDGFAAYVMSGWLRFH